MNRILKNNKNTFKLFLADNEFQELCFKFGLELDEVVNIEL